MKIYRIAEFNHVLYHGSDSDSFEGEIRLNEKDSGWFGNGFYLTAYPQYASRWGKHIYKVSLPTLNLAEVNVKNDYREIDFVGDAQQANEIAGGDEAWIKEEAFWSNKFKEALQSMGYEGIRVSFDNNKDVEVVIFDPNNVLNIEKIDENL